MNGQPLTLSELRELVRELGPPPPPPPTIRINRWLRWDDVYMVDGNVEAGSMEGLMPVLRRELRRDDAIAAFTAPVPHVWPRRLLP